MAWKAFLAQTVTKSPTSLQLEVSVNYFDDADPENAGVGPGPPIVPPGAVLHSRVFLVDPNWKQAELLEAIRQEGKSARAAYTTAAGINAQFPIGSTLTIP